MPGFLVKPEFSSVEGVWGARSRVRGWLGITTSAGRIVHRRRGDVHSDSGVRCGVGLVLSTGDPQMGIAERFSQIGHCIEGCSQVYSQA